MTEFLDGIDLTPGTIVIGVIVIFAVRAFLRGITRLVIGMIGLAVAAWAGVSVYRNGHAWLVPILGEDPSANAVLYSAWGAGLVTYLTLAATGRALANRLTGDGKTLGAGGLTGAALSLVPSLFLVWVAFAALRSSGIISELDSTDRLATADDGEQVELGGLFPRALHAIEQSRIGRLLRSIDPFAPGETAKLTQLLLFARDSDAWLQLREIPSVVAVLDHPGIGKLLRDNDIRSLIAHSDYTGLIRRPEIAETAADPEVVRALGQIDPDAVAAALTYAGGNPGQPSAGEPTIEGVPVSQIPKARVVRTRRRPH